MTYIIHWADSISQLVGMVNAAIEEGWQPQGGMAIDEAGYYYQAMVRDGESYLSLDLERSVNLAGIDGENRISPAVVGDYGED